MQARRRLRRGIAGFALALALAPAGGAQAADGALDPSFSGDGKVSAASAGSFVPRGLALQPDGRIVVAGSSCEPAGGPGADGTCLGEGDASFRLARLTPDGGLDPEFGEGGLVTTPVGTGRSQAYDVVVLPSGAIVAGGVARDRRGEGVVALARYDARGALDPGFGDGGVLLQPIGEGFAAITALRPGPDGTLLAAGQAGGRMMVVRFTAAGELDPAFGAGGTMVTGPAYGYGLGLAVDPAGGAIVAGIAGDTPDQGTYRFGISRLTPQGLPDDGFAELRPGASTSFATAAAVMPDGGWLAAGAATMDDGRPAMALVRGRPPGQPAEPLWTSLITSGRGAVADDVAALADGRAVVVGRVAPEEGGSVFATARVDPDGRLDATFDEDGVALVRWESHPHARATAVAVQPDGRLVVAGLGCAGGEGGLRCTGGRSVLLLARHLAEPAPPAAPPPQPPPPPPPPPAPPAADVRAPAAKLAGVPARVQRRTLQRRGLRVRVLPDEPVAVSARLTGRLRGARGRVLLSRTRLRGLRRATVLRLRASRRGLRHTRAGALLLEVGLRDAAGNRSRLRARITLR